MKIILLPGLDGTGSLFKGLLEALPNELDVDVISLNNLEGESYVNQAKELANKYACIDVTLIAESYSGRLAYEWCGLSNSRVRSLVFLASFISPPSLISKLAGYLPVSLLKPHRLNRYLMSKLGFAGKGSAEHVNQVFQSLERTDNHKLKQRLRNISQLDAPTAIHTIPSIYIQPSNDYLVGKNVVAILASRFHNLAVEQLTGGHFIGQSAPQECAKIINQLIVAEHLS